MLTLLPQLAIVAADLAAAFLFLFGLKRMSSPVTAPSGIAYAGIGMVVAVVASFLYALSVGPEAQPRLLVNIGLALVALAIGGGLAWRSGQRAELTAMPQMVALLNGAGGGAAAAIVLLGGVTAPVALVLTLAGALIGSVSLSGSLIAWGKLDGLIKRPLRFSGQQAVNGLAFIATLVVGGYIAFLVLTGAAPVLSMPVLIAVFFALSLIFGILMTLPLSGADMPVVISVHNAYTGLAVGLEGYSLQNTALMIAGELKPGGAGDAGIFMRYAKEVIIVPGYGLAAAQAQQKLYELVKLLQAAGVTVKFATADVALVVGANDVVNPAARTDKSSPIWGMPILDADAAKQVYVIRRGAGKGFAGIVNTLFYADNCNMVYGDDGAALVQMIEAVRGHGKAAA